MRRKIVFSLAGVFLLVGLVIYLYKLLISQGSAGYVIIGIGQWVVESSLYVVAVGLLFSFILLYVSIRLLFRAVKLPKVFKQRNAEQAHRRSQEALVSGVLQIIEGHWEKAERSLIRHVADSSTPLINYLMAARAAHSRGASEHREEYLKLAQKNVSGSELSVGLTRAELYLSTRQFEEALGTLTELNRMAPGHTMILKLLHQVYIQTRNWEALHGLIPALRDAKILTESDIRELENRTYTTLIRQKAVTNDPVALRELWRHIPQTMRHLDFVQVPYFSAMIEAGAGAEIEEEVRLALGQNWNSHLLILYSCIQVEDTEKQLHHAEAWLAPHPNDPVLLQVLGKLSMRLGNMDKAYEYLQGSLNQAPSVESYRLMADALTAKKEYASAGECYKKGLLLASREAMARIAQNHSDDTPDYSTQ